MPINGQEQRYLKTSWKCSTYVTGYKRNVTINKLIRCQVQFCNLLLNIFLGLSIPWFLSKNEKIKGFVADFSDLEAVLKMAEQIKNEVPKIDVLLNNAGILKSRTSVNGDALDIRIVVNYLAPYILTNALLPLLK